MKNLIIKREEYLNKLFDFKDKHVIKSIVGIRRSGKSTLMSIFKKELISLGIKEENIIHVNFSYYTYNNNIDDVKKKIDEVKGRMYLLFDEIQLVEDWNKMILYYFENYDCDIYITGSNSELFSSNLSTLLSGRVVDIEIFPFSYKEYLEYLQEKDSDKLLMEYMTYGGFPLALTLRDSKESELSILEDIYDTIVLKDISSRHNVKNQQMLNRISRFLMKNIGSQISIKKIKDYLTSTGFKINFETVDNYLSYLEDSLIFYRVKKYNIKAKEELIVNDKFYLTDLGMRTAVLGERDGDIGHLMENIVYFELKRQGYGVNVGKIKENEVDFIASKSDKKIYVQVCYSLRDPDTKKRELLPLNSIKDNYEKIIVVFEPSLNVDNEGIREVLLNDFLLEKMI